MITIKTKKSGNKLGSMIKAVRKLDKSYVEAGYFKSQGRHKGGHGLREYSYPALAQALECGIFPVSGEQRVPMPFMLHIGMLVNKNIVRSIDVNKEFHLWGKNLSKNGSPDRLLNAMGAFAVDQSRKVFGNPLFFPQAPRNETPVFYTGDFARNFSYRQSLDKNIKRVR